MVRLLLRIRTLLGSEIADMLIANSIFFLTRWSTFGMGVRALVLTDRLLFGGVHERDILEKADGKMACDWKIEPEESEGAESRLRSRRTSRVFLDLSEAKTWRNLHISKLRQIDLYGGKPLTPAGNKEVSQCHH